MLIQIIRVSLVCLSCFLVLLAWLAFGMPFLAVANGAYEGGMQALLPCMVYLFCALPATIINLILFLNKRLRHQRFAIICAVVLWLPIMLTIMGGLLIEIASRLRMN
jgi:hypothetical protein